MEPLLKYASIFVFTLAVATLVTVLELVWSMPDLPTAVSNDKICLPDEFGNVGCGETTDLLQDYLDKVAETEYYSIRKQAEKKQREYFSKNRVRLTAVYEKYFWEMKPSAKLTGKELSDTKYDDRALDMTPIRVWRHGRELHNTGGFLRYGVRYRNGRLVVPVSGTYFIYSFVDFYEDFSNRKSDGKKSDTLIKHGIFKFNIIDEEETEIVTNVQPQTVSADRGFNSYNSYVSTLAVLKAGDELSVKVSNITLLRYTTNNCFGLNLV